MDDIDGCGGYVKGMKGGRGEGIELIVEDQSTLKELCLKGRLWARIGRSGGTSA
jgi:hypothetical protein